MWGTIAENTHGKKQLLNPWLAAKGDAGQQSKCQKYQ